MLSLSIVRYTTEALKTKINEQNKAIYIYLVCFT